ncbi:Protein transport protein SBH2 [Gracilariopsis chorda]|uniref:Protein transport protein SBH2 n=1 Tax=Gracilariopsis chorda TaxID=448386 RepID=A0A2V3J4T0_9FLOR|nr:Protein transport protein SBH2 [Gracilariopsis chorda]|eukprot:PXF48380.1 Protein transport protein SBH2 [Gracilariopsis chorda]
MMITVTSGIEIKCVDVTIVRFPSTPKEPTSITLPQLLQSKSKMSGTGPSAAGLRKRMATAGPARGRAQSPAPARQGGSSGAFSVRLYNDTAPGFKVGPFFVVMSSIIYLVVVVALHIISRFGSK